MEIAVGNPLIDLSLLLRIFLRLCLVLILVIVGELREDRDIWYYILDVIRSVSTSRKARAPV